MRNATPTTFAGETSRVHASREPGWRSFLVRGGRATKYKGVVGGVAPHFASAGLAVVAASVATFGGGLASPTVALAGSCGPGPNVVCSGPAAPGTDTTQAITSTDGPLTITTAPGFGLDADDSSGSYGVIIDAGGTGDLKFIDENNSSIRANGRALDINTFGLTGAVEVKSTGELVGESIYGLYLYAGQHVTSSTLDLNRVESENYVGMWVENTGGALSITSSDAIIGGSATGTFNGLVVTSFGSATGGTSVDVNDVSGGASGIVIDANGSGEVSVKSSGTVSGTTLDGIYVAARSNTEGVAIDVNDVNAGRHGVNITGNAGTGDVSVKANNIDAGAIGIYLDNGPGTNNFTIDVNSITTGTDDGIYGFASGTGDVNIMVRDSIVAGGVGGLIGDGIELHVDNDAAGQVNIDVNNVKAAGRGLAIVHYSDAAADPDDNSLNITTRGTIDAGGWAIYTDTDPGVLTNITVKSTSVLVSGIGAAIFNADGNSHVVIENAAEVVDDPNTAETEISSVNGSILLGDGADQLDLHGGFSGITEVNGGYGGTNSDDVLNLFDASSTYNANSIVGWDIFNVSNSYLTLDGPLGNLNVGTAGVAGTGIFLRDGSTLESKQHGLNILGNLTLDAGTTFLSDVNDDAGNPGRGDTYITGFLTNAGTISIADGAADDDLAVHGLYTGSNGAVILDTVLGGDTSATDTMTLGDTAAGNTFVVVNNIGGAGAATSEGIKIINVSGDSLGTFTLVGDYEVRGQGVVIAGAYGYTLWQNGLNNTDGDWYLRSQLADGPDGPIFAPSVPVYESYGQILLGMNGLSTLQQRVGNRYWNDADASGAAVAPGVSPSIDRSGVWGVVEGSNAQYRSGTSTSGSEYDLSIWRMRTGVDGLVSETENGKIIAGLNAFYGQGSSDITSMSGPGSISTDAYGFGATATWYDNKGFYLDGQAQFSWFDSDLSSDLLGELAEGNNGFGYALSLEAGQRFGMSNNWAVIPQAQFIYSNVRFDSFTDQFGAKVETDASDSLRGRIGLAMEHQTSWTGAQGDIQRASFYGITNLHYEFLAGASAKVTGTKIVSENDQLWGELGLGGSYNWNDDKYSVYGEVAANSSLENAGDSYALNGKAGLRIKW